MLDRQTPLPERFWSRVDRSGDCWLWTAKISSYGYGTLMVRNHWVNAHRVAWELTNGAIPKGLHVRHRCHVRLCCNPADLSLGTNADNVRDRDLRWGRTGYKRTNRDRLSPARKRKLGLRDGWQCRYCGRTLTEASAQSDHVIPVSRGGVNTDENVVLCCASCNLRKADRTPEQAGMILLLLTPQAGG